MERWQPAPYPDPTALAVGGRLMRDVFGALADPTRLAVVETLLAQPMCTCDLVATLHLSEPARDLAASACPAHPRHDHLPSGGRLVHYAANRACSGARP